MTTPITSGAAALGGPLEVKSDPALLFPTQPVVYPSLQSPASTPPPLTTTTSLTPGANGAAPTLNTTSSGSVTDPATGITATVSGSGARANFVPNNVELALPVFSGDGAQINLISGAQTAGFVTGVGATLTQGDVKLGASYRRLTPPDLQSEGTNLYGASATVGSDLRFTGGVTVRDAPGLGSDSTTFSASLTAPLGNNWSGTLNGRAVLRPGDNNDTLGGGLSVGNGNLNLGADVSQTGNNTVGTVRFGINF